MYHSAVARAGASGRRRSPGQSLIEFAMVLVPFLLLVLGGVSAAFHSFQREVAETAAAGVQDAASASAADPSRPDLDAAVGPTLQLLRPALLGSTVAVVNGRRCDPLGSIPEGQL